MSLRNSLRLLLIGFLAVTSSGSVLAQGEGPRGPAVASALAGPGFTYQGQLRGGGSPLTATCDFQFGLWNAFTAGGRVGSNETRLDGSGGGGRVTGPPNG